MENGSQTLYGLDYRMAAWRGTEENPFHTEVGYWLWDATDSQVMRCFLIPRRLCPHRRRCRGGRRHLLHARLGGRLGNLRDPLQKFLTAQARCVRYEVVIDASAEGVFRYEEVSLIEHGKLTEHLSHTDGNTLNKIGDA